MTDNGYLQLENSIGYTFTDKKLLKKAFVHASADTGESYERLEFLGDAVLELVISEYLFINKPEFSEGELTKNRAALVNEAMLANVARKLCLSNYLILGRGERSSGGQDKPSILADAVEALIGAVYIDGGLKSAQNVVYTLLSDGIITVFSGGGFKDFKTRLQEYYHKQGISDIKYIVFKEEGPPHNRVFFVKLLVDGEEISQGKGKSKKAAEQRAARKAYMLKAK